jgi:hypothetical protein
LIDDDDDDDDCRSKRAVERRVARVGVCRLIGQIWLSGTAAFWFSEQRTFFDAMFGSRGCSTHSFGERLTGDLC